jgi:hypothetical protein
MSEFVANAVAAVRMPRWVTEKKGGRLGRLSSKRFEDPEVDRFGL